MLSFERKRGVEYENLWPRILAAERHLNPPRLGKSGKDIRISGYDIEFSAAIWPFARKHQPMLLLCAHFAMSRPICWTIILKCELSFGDMMHSFPIFKDLQCRNPWQCCISLALGRGSECLACNKIVIKRGISLVLTLAGHARALECTSRDF